MRRYLTPLPWHWFTRRPGYVRFMVREATAIFIGAWLVWLLVLLARLGDGPEAVAALLEAAASPAGLALSSLALLAALYHSVSWFNLTPKIMPMYVGEDRVPDLWAAIFMGYLPFAVISALVLWWALR